MAETALHDDELWAEFHRVVNMSSRELADWLRTRSASSAAESLPDPAGPPTGQQVLRILSKRRTDLTKARLADARSGFSAGVSCSRCRQSAEPVPRGRSPAGPCRWYPGHGHQHDRS